MVEKNIHKSDTISTCLSKPGNGFAVIKAAAVSRILLKIKPVMVSNRNLLNGSGTLPASIKKFRRKKTVPPRLIINPALKGVSVSKETTSTINNS